MTGPSPSSVVKLEANQKARNKKQRQELYGKTVLGNGFTVNSVAPNLHGKHLFNVLPPGFLVWSKSVSLIERHRLPESVWSRGGGQSEEEAPLQAGPGHRSQKPQRRAATRRGPTAVCSQVKGASLGQHRDQRQPLPEEHGTRHVSNHQREVKEGDPQEHHVERSDQ